ncbi:MAG: hypothetical protein F4149_07340 [Gammaproteobacteria bacterium]|nr:hypothetical protein [Rhodospirillaceae bacterium]MYH14974.1 hypothetical protein [Gammaproteobacteria bacterium]MYK29145.1 hypothetical protein [Gammaproteobacteria bacterium]
MDIREVRSAVFDGRASTRQICALAAQCGAAESMAWNDMIRIPHPEIPVPDLPERPMYEKALLWGTAGDGIQYTY